MSTFHTSLARTKQNNSDRRGNIGFGSNKSGVFLLEEDEENIDAEVRMMQPMNKNSKCLVRNSNRHTTEHWHSYLTACSKF